MKNLRQFSVACAFTLALALPIFAGEIQTTITSPQPAQAATTNGEIQTGITGQIETTSGEATATDSVTQAALHLLQSVLALF